MHHRPVRRPFGIPFRRPFREPLREAVLIRGVGEERVFWTGSDQEVL